jgi:hypothetical protein
MKGPTKAKNDRKGAYKGKKMRKKGPTEFKMKEIDPQKILLRKFQISA